MVEVKRSRLIPTGLHIANKQQYVMIMCLDDEA